MVSALDASHDKGDSFPPTFTARSSSKPNGKKNSNTERSDSSPSACNSHFSPRKEKVSFFRRENNATSETQSSVSAPAATCHRWKSDAVSLVKERRRKKREQEQQFQQKQKRKRSKSVAWDTSSKPVATPSTTASTPTSSALSPASTLREGRICSYEEGMIKTPEKFHGSQDERKNKVSFLQHHSSAPSSSSDDSSASSSSSSSCGSSASPVPIVRPMPRRMTPGFNPPLDVNYFGHNPDATIIICSSTMSESPVRATEPATATPDKAYVQITQHDQQSFRSSRKWFGSNTQNTDSSVQRKNGNESQITQDYDGEEDDELAAINAGFNSLAVNTPNHHTHNRRPYSLSRLGSEGGSGVWHRPSQRSKSAILSEVPCEMHRPSPVAGLGGNTCGSYQMVMTTSSSRGNQSFAPVGARSQPTSHAMEKDDNDGGSVVSANIGLKHSLSSGSHSLPAIVSPAYRFQPIGSSDSSTVDGYSSGSGSSRTIDVRSVERGSTITDAKASSSLSIDKIQQIPYCVTSLVSDPNTLMENSRKTPAATAHNAMADDATSSPEITKLESSATELDTTFSSSLVATDESACADTTITESSKNVHQQQSRQQKNDDDQNFSSTEQWSVFDLPLLFGKCVCEWTGM